jgi:hypothetical protein
LAESKKEKYAEFYRLTSAFSECINSNHFGRFLQKAGSAAKHRSPVAQLVEQAAVNRLVAGSSPARGAIKIKRHTEAFRMPLFFLALRPPPGGLFSFRPGRARLKLQ